MLARARQAQETRLTREQGTGTVPMPVVDGDAASGPVPQLVPLSDDATERWLKACSFLEFLRDTKVVWSLKYLRAAYYSHACVHAHTCTHSIDGHARTHASSLTLRPPSPSSLSEICPLFHYVAP